VFPPGFFDRMDPTPDSQFYRPPRLVAHIDDRAITAVGALYAELAVDGEVLDLMTSWVSHFRYTPHRLVGLGMNTAELHANPLLAEYVVHDLNADPILPFADESFDDVTCCVSVDYLIHPITVFRDIARVLRPSGRLIITFSNRCFPTKAIQGWLNTDDEQHVQIVAAYFSGSAAFGPGSMPSYAPRRAPATRYTRYGHPAGRRRPTSNPARRVCVQTPLERQIVLW
jgi:SAM-dependent methyltransferase